MNRLSVVLMVSLLSSSCFALTVSLFSSEQNTTSIGTIEITQTQYGVLLTPKLKNLSSGPHGFHLHQNPSCDDHAMAAGGHFDPAKTDKHLGPYGKGHLGDLPVLWANSDGTATTPILAPRLKIKDFPGHTLMIHAGGDNYSDNPEKLGGGGARIACGIISK